MSIATGRKILQKFSQTAKPPVSAELLDQAFSAWIKDTSSFTHEEIANGLGCLFGDSLQQSFPFSWKIIDDDYGSEPALVDEATGSVIFPVNAVWKRIEPRLLTEAFFQPMFATIEKHLGEKKHQ
jgi:hypothetical protein